MSRRKLAFILLVGVLAIAVASLLWWRQRPLRVVEAAVQKMVEAKTQRFSSLVRIENSQATADILGEQATIELAVNGVYRREPQGRDSMDSQVALTTKTDSVTLLVEGDLRFIGDQAYLKITKAPLSFPAVAALKDLWISMPRGASAGESKLNSDEQIFTEVKKGKSWQEQGKPNARLYQATATSVAVLRLLDGIAQILGTHLSDEQIGSIREGIAKGDSLPVELAVASWRRELYQIKTATTTPGSNNNVSVEINFSERDKEVEIKAPDGARKLEDIAAQK